MSSGGGLHCFVRFRRIQQPFDKYSAVLISQLDQFELLDRRGRSGLYLVENKIRHRNPAQTGCQLNILFRAGVIRISTCSALRATAISASLTLLAKCTVICRVLSSVVLQPHNRNKHYNPYKHYKTACCCHCPAFPARFNLRTRPTRDVRPNRAITNRWPRSSFLRPGLQFSPTADANGSPAPIPAQAK